MSIDPRDKRFYALHKKDRSQLSVIEIRELMEYCDQMMKFVTEKKGRRMWRAYGIELGKLLEDSSQPD